MSMRMMQWLPALGLVVGVLGLAGLPGWAAPGYETRSLVGDAWNSKGITVAVVWPTPAAARRRASSTAIPASMPAMAPSPPQGGESIKTDEEKPTFFEIWGFNTAMMAEQPWYIFFPSLLPFVIGMIYSAITTIGGVKMQNLESRGWAITSSILSILPIHTLGIQIVTALVVTYIFGAVLEDVDFGQYVSLGFMVIQYIIALVVGIWCLKTLWDPDVIDGFEFDPD